MQSFEQLVGAINGFVWGPVMLVLILGTGLYMQIRLGALPIRKLGYGFKQLFSGRKGQGEGEISPFNALMTSLSATIGTGNIAGVATAIGIGGPGALFWMWCTALVGMATKYSEAVLAVNFREKNADGQWVGGPMYYIRNGLSSRFGKAASILAVLFAIFGMLAGFGIGSTVQANSVAEALNHSFGIEKYVTGIVMSLLVLAVLVGGLKSIAKVAGALVPVMAIAYILAGLVILLLNASAVPDAFMLIIKAAFDPQAATGGLIGASIMIAIQMGVARGVFSNEAGLGSAPIAHAAAETDSPVRQGVVAMLGTFIDTIIVCTITGLAIVVTGVWSGDAQGAAMSASAFGKALPYGDMIISLGLAVFAFTTILGWSYYGERCAEYLFGTRINKIYRILWAAAVYFGTIMSLDLVWGVADTLNGMMAIPNLIGLLLLSPVVIKLSKAYFAEEDVKLQSSVNS